MKKKTLLISSVLSVVLLFLAVGVCFAGTSELLLQADTYREQGQYEQAEAIYLQIITGYPGTDYALEAQKKLTLIYIATDRQQQADAAFGQLVTAFSGYPGITQAVWQIAKEYQQRKKYNKALELHQYNVQKFTPDKHTMWSQVEIIYSLIDSGDAAADAACEKLIIVFSEQETLPKEIHQIATKYNQLKRYDKALELHQCNADLSPKDNIYAMWSQVELVKYHIGDANETAAVAACDTLLIEFSEQPDLPKEVYQIADLYSKAGKDDKALDLHYYNVEQLSKEDKYTMWSLVEIIKSHMQNAAFATADEACDMLMAKFSKQPAFPTELYQIALRYKKSGRDEKALEFHKFNIEHSSKDDKHTMWSKVEIVKSHIRDANDVAADEAFGELLSEFSGQATLPKEIYQIVDEYAMAGRYDKADQVYQQVLSNWPEAREYGLGHIGVAEINILDLIDLENYPAAKEALGNLIVDFNDHTNLAWTLDGIAGRYEKAQKYEEARSIYQKILADYNETDYAFTTRKKLAILEIKAGDDVAAQEALEVFITDFNDHPNLPEAVFVVGEQYYSKAIRYKFGENNVEREKGFIKAIAVWEIIIKQPTSPITPQAYNFMAICHDRLGQYEIAIKYYQKVLDDWPDYKHACYSQYQIGRCYERLKNTGTLTKSEADPLIRTAYEAVVKNYPDCSSVKAAQNWLDYNKKPVKGGQ